MTNLDFRKISEQVEGQISELFEELRSGISEREDSRAFGAMIERRITDHWQTICQTLDLKPFAIPGRRTIFDFAAQKDGVLLGFDVKTKDLDSTKYSDGGVCAIGNLLKYLANDKGVFMLIEFGHCQSGSKGSGRDLEYIRVAPFHCLPADTYRIENLGTGQVRLNYTIQQVWDEILWNRSYPEFFEIFCEKALNHYRRVKADADKRIQSILQFQESGYEKFKFVR